MASSVAAMNHNNAKHKPSPTPNTKTKPKQNINGHKTNGYHNEHKSNTHDNSNVNNDIVKLRICGDHCLWLICTY